MENYIVICLDWDESVGMNQYVLATRRVFATEDDASSYAETVAMSREPRVVAGRFHELRIDTIAA